MALTFATIQSEVAGRLRLDLNQTAQKTLVKGWINQALQDVHSRYDWWWALDRAIVQTVADVSTGTVSVSAGGTTATGSSTVFAASDVGKFIQFSGSDDWYKITAVASTISLTIEKAYTQSTDLAAGTYTIRKIFYSLSNAEKIITVSESITPRKLTCIHFRDYDTFNPFSTDTGKGERYFIYGTASGAIQFTVNPFPDEVYNLEIRYKKAATELSADGEAPDIPEKWRNVLIDGALSRGMEYIALGNPDFDRTAAMVRQKRADFEAGIARMLADAEPVADYHPQLRSSEIANVPSGPHLPEGLSIPTD